jgi:hypothetical protein
MLGISHFEIGSEAEREIGSEAEREILECDTVKYASW